MTSPHKVGDGTNASSTSATSSSTSSGSSASTGSTTNGRIVRVFDLDSHGNATNIRNIPYSQALESLAATFPRSPGCCPGCGKSDLRTIPAQFLGQFLNGASSSTSTSTGFGAVPVSLIAKVHFPDGVDLSNPEFLRRLTEMSAFIRQDSSSSSAPTSSSSQQQQQLQRQAQSSLRSTTPTTTATLSTTSATATSTAGSSNTGISPAQAGQNILDELARTPSGFGSYDRSSSRGDKKNERKE